MTQRTPRLEWVDTGRGIAILLVAVYHSTNWMRSAGLSMGTWTTVNEILSSLRMPLFFMLSGLFAAKWQSASWPGLYRSKLRLFAWVLCLWAVIGMTVTLVGYTLAGVPISLRTAAINLVRTPVLPPFELWFIWALAVFFVVAKLTRRVDHRVQLVVAGAVSSVALSVWITTTTGWTGALKYYFFFLVGLHLRRIVIAAAGGRRVTSLLLIVVGWSSVSVALSLAGIRGVYPLYFLNCCVGLIGGVALSRLLCRMTLLRWLGSRTLPVYLAHTPFIILMYAVMAQPGMQDIVKPVQQVLPAGVAIVAVTLALALHRVSGRGLLRYLYVAPPAPRIVGKAIGNVTDHVLSRGRAARPVSEGVPE